MARDVFSREVTFGAAFSADGARVTFGDFGCGFLVQNLNYQYQQNISRLYEIGCPDIYLVAGRTQGQFSFQRVIGPKRIVPAFYQQFGNACNAGENNIKITARAGCSGGGADAGARQMLDIKHAVIQTVGGTINANDMIINESLSMMFLYLQIK